MNKRERYIQAVEEAARKIYVESRHYDLVPPRGITVSYEKRLLRELIEATDKRIDADIASTKEYVCLRVLLVRDNALYANMQEVL